MKVDGIVTVLKAETKAVFNVTVGGMRV